MYNHFQSYSEAFFDVNDLFRSGYDNIAKIMMRLPNLPSVTEGNQVSYSLKGADFKSGFIFYLK